MPVLSNAKYELFCQHLALGKTASEAYEMAGYKPSRSNASVLRAKQNVSDRINELLGEASKKLVKDADYSREKILAEIEEARLMALDKGMPGPAWQAAIAKARVLGLIIDRREVGEIGAFDHLTDEELMKAAEEKARELGLCVQPLNKAH
jgi:hypothetical protein